MNRLKLVIYAVIITAALTGCMGAARDRGVRTNETESTGEEQNDVADSCTELTALCRDIYSQSRLDGTLGSLGTVRALAERLGGAGYTAADQDNQIDMKNPKQLEDFCRKVDEKLVAEQRLIVVLNNGGFVDFILTAEAGRVNVTAYCLSWKEEDLVVLDTYHYEAEPWTRSDNGYLFFEKDYMEGFSGPFDHTAIRIEPLDEADRESNRSYILPLGYHTNNLFTTDWSEDDFQSLNFYDLFENLYRNCFMDNVPDLSVGDGEVLQIPQAEFEEVIMAYFDISSQELKKRTNYQKDTGTYEYRPRGLYDSGMGMSLPYPEVIGYEKRKDGTAELTVNAVWPERNLGTAFQHKVVIRPLSDGRFQYVSNQVIKTGHQVEPEWYTERLGKEAWEYYYGKTGDIK